MPEFLTALSSTKTAKGWRLNRPLIYHSDIVGRVHVPAGFLTDYASVPRIPVIYSLVGNRAHEPAVIHDYLYTVGAKPDVSQKDADRTFLEAMRLKGVPWLYRKMMYAGVRIGGFTKFKKETK